MDNERDDFLNNLIKYYDDKDSESEQETVSPPETSGDTIVLPKSPQLPHDENLGDTVIVNTVSKPHETVVTDNGETTAIPVAHTEKNEPVEEVFGNLGLDGKPLVQEETPKPRRRIEIPDPVTFGTAKTSVSIEQPIKKTGVWHSLKPLWASVIVTVLLSSLYCAYKDGYIDKYIFNFKCNLELICERLGIDYNPFDYTEYSESNPDPTVLSGFAGTITLSKAEAGEGYTEKNNVRTEDFSDYNSIKEYRSCLPFDDAGNSGFSAFDNGIVCAKSNYICYLTEKGEKKWEFRTSVSEPIISTSGNYIAIAAKNGTDVCLYESDKLMYTAYTDNKIKSCKVSYNGDIVLVTEKQAYKGAVVVLNKKGEEVFSWVSGVNYITSATPLKNRKVAVTLTDTSKNVISYIMIFDIYSPDPIGAAELTDTLLYDSSFSSDMAYASGDNCIAAVNLSGETVYDVRFDSVAITRSSSDAYGNRLVTFTENYIPAMNLYNKKGELIHSEVIDASPDCTDIYESTVLYNNGREIICGDVESDKRTVYTAPMNVKQLILINDSSYAAIYEDTIEFIGI